MKPIFSYHDKDIMKAAYLNWRITRHDHINNMLSIAEGYEKSALMLTKELLRDNLEHDADILIFPILFNTNHAIEVYLKAIKWNLHILLNEDKSFNNKHHLNILIDDVIQLANRYSDADEIQNRLARVKGYIEELYSKIVIGPDQFKDITFSRYSLTTQKQPQFYVQTTDNVVIDLENYYEFFSELLKDLRCTADYYKNIWDEVMEARANLDYE